MNGKLIVLFGIDGSGKTTINNMLANCNLNNTVCTSCMINPVFENELYIAENELHFRKEDYFSREFKHLLHIGSVVFDMFNRIIPIQKNGSNVILDRYDMCIKQYAELFLDTPYHCISNILECLPTPNLGVYFDSDVHIAFERVKKRSMETGLPIHYSESLESLILKKSGYEEMMKGLSYKVVRIDANQEVDQVLLSVLNKLTPKLEEFD